MRLRVDVAEHPHSQHKRSGSLLLPNEGSRAPRQMSRGGKDGTGMFSLMGDTPVEKRKGQNLRGVNSFGFFSPES